MSNLGPEDLRTYPYARLVDLIKLAYDSPGLSDSYRNNLFNNTVEALNQMPVPAGMVKEAKSEFEREIKAFRKEVKMLLSNKTAEEGKKLINQRVQRLAEPLRGPALYRTYSYPELVNLVVERRAPYADIAKALEQYPTPPGISNPREFANEIANFRKEVLMLLKKDNRVQKGELLIKERAAMLATTNLVNTAVKEAYLIKGDTNHVAKSVVAFEEFINLSKQEQDILTTLFKGKRKEKDLLQTARSAALQERTTILSEIEFQKLERNRAVQKLIDTFQISSSLNRVEELIKQAQHDIESGKALSQALIKARHDIINCKNEAEKLIKAALVEPDLKIVQTSINLAKNQGLEAQMRVLELEILLSQEKAESLLQKAKVKKNSPEKQHFIDLATIEFNNINIYIAQLETLQADTLARQITVSEKSAPYRALLETESRKAEEILDELRVIVRTKRESSERRSRESQTNSAALRSRTATEMSEYDASEVEFNVLSETADMQAEGNPANQRAEDTYRAHGDRPHHEEILSDVEVRLAEEQCQQALSLIDKFEENILRNPVILTEERSARLQGTASVRAFITELKGQKNLLPRLRAYATEKIESCRNSTIEEMALSNKLKAESQLATALYMELASDRVPLLTPAAEAHGVHKQQRSIKPNQLEHAPGVDVPETGQKNKRKPPDSGMKL